MTGRAVRRSHVCPFWMGYVLLCPLRRLYQNARSLLGPYLREGMTVVELGPGMGFFTLDIARMIGPHGRVIAIDIQPRMLERLGQRARRAGLVERVELRMAGPGRTGMEDLDGRADLLFAAAVVHELPDPSSFFRDASRALRPGGILLVSEPRGHVTEEEFGRMTAFAVTAGLQVAERSIDRGSRTVALTKPESALGPGASAL